MLLQSLFFELQAKRNSFIINLLANYVFSTPCAIFGLLLKLIMKRLPLFFCTREFQNAAVPSDHKNQ